LSADDITQFCKDKNIPTFGTKQDRIIRVKKFLGIKVEEIVKTNDGAKAPTRLKVAQIEKQRIARRNAQEEAVKFKVNKQAS